ncbi:DNA starvation/stationary phase protection protein [uncultured Desulfuromusa sp.]|uniref:Dps family protein n=1 Tax=uncultured Desulfuromusa sp. TaxID=219183 RepID=UPI002AA7D5A9|nr:DNA starvation/stationary phase protection protein [uncultured Desulfuromusa sp.]
MSKVTKMNEYIANLHVWNVKLHNLHWNVTGEQFPAVHKFTEDLYEEVFEKFDDVAEQLKIQGKSPAATIAEYAQLATIKEIPARDFPASEALKIVREDMEQMKQLSVDIRALADEDGDFSTVAMMEDHADGYAKNLWFLSAMQR